MAKMKYDSIPPDALITIEISGAFHRRMVDLLTMLGESVPLDEFKVTLERIKGNEPAKDMFELNVHTLMSLVYEVEKQAVAQKQTVVKEIEVEDEVPSGN